MIWNENTCAVLDALTAALLLIWDIVPQFNWMVARSIYNYLILLICLSCSNYTALVGVWIYGFFVMVLLALDFLYYSAINYELCRVYLEKWGLGGRWLKKARSQWNRSMPEESETQAQAQPMVPGHYQPRHSLRGESQSPSLLPYNTSTAWWVTVW